MPPVFSFLDYIYPGPLVDRNGRLDTRVWFFIPLSTDVERQVAVYLKFPYGCAPEEITEEEIDISGYTWTD